MSFRHRKRLATYLLLGLALVQCVNCLPELIHIGGLFGDDELETTENTFKYSVYRINHERSLLRNTKLHYETRKLPTKDTFLSSKEVCSQVHLSTAALFGPRSNNIASFTNSLCSALHIPHIEFREDGNMEPPQGYSINLHPNAQQLAQAYQAVIEYYRMKELLIIYGEKEGLVKMQNILRSVSQEPSKNVYIRQADRTNMRQVLKEAKKKNWTNMIVDMNATGTGLLLKIALQEGMIDPYHHYIFTTLDIDSIELENYKHNYVNLTGFRLVDPQDEFTRQIIEDMYVYEANTQLKLINDVKNKERTIPYESALMFDAVLLFAKALEEMDRSVAFRPVNVSCDVDYFWPTGSSLYEFLTMSHVRGLTGEIRLQQGRRLDFKLDVMQLNEKGLYKAGFWTHESGFNFTYKESTQVGVLGNKTLVITTVLDDPYVMIKEELKDDPDQEKYGNNLYEGFCVDLLKEISDIVHFDYKITQVPDGKYGVLNNGQWNGVIGQLVERKADIAVAALTISYEREQSIDFTKPFLNLGISILFRMPKREKPGLFSFLNPLAIEIWIYVIAAYLLVSFSIFVLARFSPYEWYNPHPCNPETDTVQNTFNLSNSFWFTVGTLMQQGSDINPRAVSTRIVGGTWWFFTLIIISSYTANLAAFLTVERMDSPIESAEDLAKQTEISYGTLEGGSTMTFFKDSNIELYQKMWNSMNNKEPRVFTNSMEEGIRRTMDENYAFFMESTSIEYITQRNCKLMQIGGLLDSKGFGIGTPMDSPLRDRLSMAILQMQEEGRIQLLYNKWWKSTGKCSREEQKESKANALGVENVGGIFVVLLGGLALAVFVAILEFLWKSRRNAREDRQSICSEMAEELRFAVRCHGSSKKPKFKRTCAKCKKRHITHCPLTEVQVDSPNGMLTLREMKKSPNQPSKEFQFGEGGYLHVDYSDTDT
ncbi:glutamate receptor ionotropic, kainate 2-like [Ylistrum balloti]|uniref:glutamate receptor ionotropic, kainate 2-like n=1 Tax=Ylistrum balloti TaxID=509963 RepID=UPI0029058640|nr:glutamate receptor ionotropic, kainate 2-like [Ylistrum balloti]